MNVEQSIKGIFNDWLYSYEFEFDIQNEKNYETSFTLECTFIFKVERTHKYYSGRHSCNCGSSRECMNDLSTYSINVTRGTQARVIEKAKQRIQSDPIDSFHGFSDLDSIERSYQEACNNCGGNGNVTCSPCAGRGSKHCYACCNGRQNCYSCGGSGRVNSHNNTTLSCYSCNGTGSTYCSTCSGTARITCQTCLGCGYVGCTSCGSTGWFTHFYTATTHCSTKKNYLWSNEGAPDWLGKYVDSACKSLVPQADLIDVMHWDLTSLSVGQGYPFQANINGQLSSTDALISVDKSTSYPTRFVGEQHVPYDLNGIMDTVVSKLIQNANRDRSIDKIGRLFNCRLFWHNIDEYQAPGRPNNLISTAELLGYGCCADIKSFFVTIGDHFKAQRNSLKPINLLTWTAIMGCLGAVALSASKTFTHSATHFNLSLVSIVRGAPDTIQSIWYYLLYDPISFFIGLYVLFIPSMLAMRLVGRISRPSAQRMLRWFFVVAFLICLVFGPLFETNLRYGARNWSNEKFVYHIKQFDNTQIWFEVFLITFPLALLRSRRTSYRKNKKITDGADCTQLDSYLGYK